MPGVLRPARRWQRLQSLGWLRPPMVVGGAPIRVWRDERYSTLVVRLLWRSLTRRRCRSSDSPNAARGGGGGAGGARGGGAEGGGGGRVGSASASPAPNPSLGLAGRVVLEVLVVGLLQMPSTGHRRRRA